MEVCGEVVETICFNHLLFFTVVFYVLFDKKAGWGEVDVVERARDFLKEELAIWLYLFLSEEVGKASLVSSLQV